MGYLLESQHRLQECVCQLYNCPTVDDLSLLAKEVIEHSRNLNGNVNRVTDKLTSRNPQVITLSTLREMMKSFATSEHLDASELAGMAAIAAQFYDMLARIRPELGKLTVLERKQTRDTKIVDSAVMMHGYAALMKDYNHDLVELGTSKARLEWNRRLTRLGQDVQHSYGRRWRGDLFDKRNPLWLRVGIAKPGRDGVRITVLNTGAARSECGRILRGLIASDRPAGDLRPLAKR